MWCSGPSHEASRGKLCSTRPVPLSLLHCTASPKPPFSSSSLSYCFSPSLSSLYLLSKFVPHLLFLQLFPFPCVFTTRS